MPVSNELMMAILAMDAYNRGYNLGIVGPEGNSQTGVGLTGWIGNARINTSVLLPAGSVAASFYAQSYEYDGKTVIS